MKVLLTTLNAKYIHKNLALRWLYVSRPKGMEVIVKEFVIRDDLAKITAQIQQEKPDVIGISVYIWNAQPCQQWIQMLHQALPDTRIIIGGPEVTYEYEPWLDLPIQAVLRGEGEKTFWQAVAKEEGIDGYASKEYISPVAYAKVSIAWLETLESPYYLEMDQQQMTTRYLYLETSRGCPYQCSYCLSSLDRQVRMFSLPYVLNQLEKLKTIEVKQVKFLDRTYNVDPHRALEIARYIETLPLGLSFQFEIVADTLSEELLQFFETEANPKRYRFEIGVQSLNEKTLKAVSRHQDNEKLKEVVQRLLSHGYIAHLDLIAGLPYEAMDSFEQSFLGLFELHPSEIQVGILKLLKGTSLKSQVDQWGIQYSQASPYTVVSTNWMKQEELESIEDVYHATEKYYNSGRLRNAIDLLIEQNPQLSPFQFLMDLGKRMQHLANPYQLADLYSLCFLEMAEVVSELEASARVNTDYYMNCHKRPKRFHPYQPSVALKKELRKRLVGMDFDEGLIYNYTNVEYGWHNQQVELQVLIYHDEQSKPERHWFQIESWMEELS